MSGEPQTHAMATALAELGDRFERYAAGTREAADAPARSPLISEPPALVTLGERFGLSSFERCLLLACAGVELDGGFAQACAAAQGDPQCPWLSFGLALAVLPDPHWSALSSAGPLRRWRLISLNRGEGLTRRRLHIDEHVLHHLIGTPSTDEGLDALVSPLLRARELVPSHRALVDEIVEYWTGTGPSRAGVVLLCGPGVEDKHAIAAAVCHELGLVGRVSRASELPAPPVEQELLARLWEREAALSGAALLLDCDDDDDSTRPGGAALSFLDRVGGPVLVSSREPLSGRRRVVIQVDVDAPAVHEQRAVWSAALASSGANRSAEAELEFGAAIDEVVGQFRLSTGAIMAAAASARLSASAGAREALWAACRVQARPALDALVQRIDSRVSWEQLVLPAASEQLLREVSAQVRCRRQVYERWGFAGASGRGLGISALFAGPSGTGKTLAAEVLANELGLDLYRVDLSAVVSKYVGETEKNLRRVFDAAESGGVVLLFDEADALFGKRSQVKDAHDRHANVEVGYLLQRMEAYRGLAILTTNLEDSLDPAFLRRIRFVVRFPFPDLEQRAELWRRAFPAQTPTAGLDAERLAALALAGGNIRNIALNAAFLAADRDEAVGMAHVARAAAAEYTKLAKPLAELRLAELQPGSLS